MSTTWLIPALVAQVSFVAAILIDKIVLTHRGMSQRVIAVCTGITQLILAACLFAGVGLPDASGGAIVGMLLSGALGYAYLVPYFAALNHQDASSVVPILLTTPLFAFGFGLFGLGALPGTSRLVSAALVLIGALLFQAPTWRRGAAGHRSNEVRPVLLMLLASGLAAGSLALFGEFGTQYGFGRTLTVVSLGTAATALGGSVVIRDHSGTAIRMGWVGASGLVAAETFASGGNALVDLATTLTSPSLVATTMALEPVLLLLGGVALTRYVPRLLAEHVTGFDLMAKTVGTVVLCAGLIGLAIGGT